MNGKPMTADENGKKNYKLPRDKAALIYIYQILKNYSDKDHPLKQQDIIDKLEDEYNIGMERKAVKRNLTVLESTGAEIKYLKTGCYLVGKPFKDAELRLLIDSVLCSKHISASQSKSLISRLADLSNVYFKYNINHIHTVEDWDKTKNEALFYNIEKIDEAIRKRRQIHYDYNKYGIDGKLHKSSQQYVSPYQIILHNQRYYLMAYSEHWGNMVYHRLDHMTNMMVTDKKAILLRDIKGYEGGLDYKRFATQMPYMYADDPKAIEFIADIEIMDQVVDWFGSSVKMREVKGDSSKIYVNVRVSPLAMKIWALQYLDHVEVVFPKSLREEIKESIKKAEGKYR